MTDRSAQVPESTDKARRRILIAFGAALTIWAVMIAVSVTQTLMGQHATMPWYILVITVAGVTTLAAVYVLSGQSLREEIREVLASWRREDLARKDGLTKRIVAVEAAVAGRELREVNESLRTLTTVVAQVEAQVMRNRDAALVEGFEIGVKATPVSNVTSLQPRPKIVTHD